MSLVNLFLYLATAQHFSPAGEKKKTTSVLTLRRDEK